MRKSAGRLVIWLFIIYISCFFLQKIHLVTADLGRHIQNGQIILKDGLNSPVLNSNFYSYTWPDYQVINHHWLYGLAASLIYSKMGFSGLTIFNAVVMTAAIGLMLMLSAKLTQPKWALIAGLIALPLLTARSEIRPETISFLLFSLTSWLLVKFSSSQLKPWQLITGVGLIQLLWVNIHIFFIFNFGLVGMFWLLALTRYLQQKNSILNRKSPFQLRTLSFALIGLGILSLFNPAGWQGVLAPLHIFDNYGYRVLENQSIPFLIKITDQIIPWYLVIITSLALLVAIFWLLKQVLGIAVSLIKASNHEQVSLLKKSFLSLRPHLFQPLFPFIPLTLIFLIANFAISRLYPFTGLLMIPALSLIFSLLPINPIISKITAHHLSIMISPLVVMFLIVLCLRSGLFTPNLNRFGFGLPSSQLASVNFFNQYLSGPIFNNYDIGGFLIFGIYPKSKVYVDNRPEAYPTDFLTKYTEAQEKVEVWDALDQEYGFETIFFYRHDLTTWAQPFLIERIKDPFWVPVFVDDSVLILVKNDSQNQKVIENFTLPSDIFQF